MQITFIENSLDFTSTSFELKALDYKQKNLINFALELRRKGHKIIIYNNTKTSKFDNNIEWKKLNTLKGNHATDILIVCDDVDFINIRIEAKVKFFWINFPLDQFHQKSTLINLIKYKFTIIVNHSKLTSNLSENFNYVPKFTLGIGVSEAFFNFDNHNISKCNALVTVHPLRGLDWLIDVWVNIISLKIPWAEMHIFSKSLHEKKFNKNVKINNIKLNLIKYKNNGIVIKKPLPEKDFINCLSDYRVHLNPSIHKDLYSQSIAESQAAGIPAVSRMDGHIYEIIYDNETGYIANDKKQFARKTIELMSDNALFFRLSKNSKLNNNIYKWNDIVTNFERKINEDIIHR